MTDRRGTLTKAPEKEKKNSMGRGDEMEIYIYIIYSIGAFILLQQYNAPTE